MQLLSAARSLKRGAIATDGDKETVERLAVQLEVNGCVQPEGSNNHS
jgi:hypothetical protein